MEIKKILWPTDLSEGASQALPYAASLAEKYQAEVYLLHVVEDLHEFEPIHGDAIPNFLKEFQEKVSQRGERLLEETRQKELTVCPGYRKQVVVGDPAQEILKAIKKENIDLVVMATHGHGDGVDSKGMVFFPVGSITEKVMRSSPVPVFIVTPLENLPKRKPDTA